jgi:hypothetical protein
MRATYCIEVLLPSGSWREICRDSSKSYIEGRFEGFRSGEGPRPACRVVRLQPGYSATVVDRAPEKSDLSLGMVVGTDMSGFRMRAIIRALRVTISELELGSGRRLLPPDSLDILRSCTENLESVLESLQGQDPHPSGD